MTADGGDDGFDAWYSAERPKLVAVLRRLGTRPADAEEVADEAMARALLRWDRVSRLASPAGWTAVVAFNLVRRGAARHRRDLEEAARAARGIPAEAAAPDADGIDLWRAVAALPRRQREAVVLRFVHDLPEADIAALLKVRRGTVASTLSDARRALAAALAPSPTPSSAPRS